MRNIRLLIADGYRLMAEACAKMLQAEYEIVGVVTDGRSLLRTAVELRPDTVIIEVSMPQLNGLDAAEQIKRKLPCAKIMFLTMNSDPELATEAFRRGHRDISSSNLAPRLDIRCFRIAIFSRRAVPPRYNTTPRSPEASSYW